ncbi:MAG: hypothetical protein KatS3mg113_1033 [Planctomycetaceae bacterium]|nr:MAG: hypothetical protein KatS3mg113_1033 [Planctomycetaceae bacterium]
MRNLCWLGCLLLPGCIMFDVGVTNPVAGLTTVAVAPFFNLSDERAVDGRRFALAYYSELQKTPGFQVVPVGVVEQALFDMRLELNSPRETLQLAKTLHVDAVVVGAITEYSPYYPPRIGWQVSWYSPQPWTFEPGIPTDEQARRNILKYRFGWKFRARRGCLPGYTCAVDEPDPLGDESFPGLLAHERYPVLRAQSASSSSGTPASWAWNPEQPFMSYTRLFDGADPKIAARLRDYVELSGDLRAGGWEAYLHRSDDFIRFTAHLMIVEMLQLHGGESQRRLVVKLRQAP